VNIVALFTAFVGSVILKESPLQPIQLLWVNLIMDSFASLALATEAPTKELLDRPPYRRDEYIISRKMVKNMVGMAIYQIIVIYSIVFAGEYFFPEPSVEYRYGRDSQYVFPGRLTDWDGSPLWELKVKKEGDSRHMTNVFNIFVCLQIFNLINARKIHDEKNVFSGLFTNWMFIGVWIGITVAQVLIIEFGSMALKVSPHGLHIYHWIIAIGAGLSTYIVAFFVKYIPDTWCPQFGVKQINPLDESQDNVLNLRRKRTQSFSLRQPSGAGDKEGSQRQGSLRGQGSLR
jgi:Ca2+ transporting ATPase